MKSESAKRLGLCSVYEIIYRTYTDNTEAEESERINSGKLVSVFFILVIVLGLLLLTVIKIDVASAQGTEGYFESAVPVQGAYLQSSACFPLIGEDKDGDGV